MQATQLAPLRCWRSNSCFRLWGNAECMPSWIRPGSQNSNRIPCRRKSYIAPQGEQAFPLKGFYAEMLNKPLPQVQSMTRSQPEPSPADSQPKTEKEKTIEKARIIFGTRLAGPGERKKELDEASTMVAGIMVPPKPTEPDNCCMSGCVNCVWDLYRDEMEEWAEKSAQARAAMKAQRLHHEVKAGSNAAGSTQAVSMDDDGGGSETNWTEETSKGDLFADIPVGIRAFMETEKKLKQMHEREKTNVA